MGALLLAACAPRITVRVPAEAVQSLPLERRLALLDAESDRLAAIDRRDEAEEKALEAEEAAVAAEKRRDEAEDALAKVRQQKQPPEVAEAVLAEAQARVTHAAAAHAWWKAKLETAELEVLVAQAKEERTRASELVAAGLAPAFKVDPAKYDAQVERLEAAKAEQAAREVPRKAKADEARAAWDKEREKLSRLTGGAKGSVWVK